jgi:hypothetical protein
LQVEGLKWSGAGLIRDQHGIASVSTPRLIMPYLLVHKRTGESVVQPTLITILTKDNGEYTAIIRELEY